MKKLRGKVETLRYGGVKVVGKLKEMRGGTYVKCDRGRVSGKKRFPGTNKGCA